MAGHRRWIDRRLVESGWVISASAALLVAGGAERDLSILEGV